MNFCTLFDTYYLSRGIALYQSLEKHCGNFHLYIFAFNDKCYNILKKLSLPKATIISLKEFEDAELLKVKPTRTIAEYCWTSTSSTILYVLEKYKVESCTYLDADLFFYASPLPIFEEMGDSSILITEHRYSPQYNKEVKSGKYCVQFVTVKNDERGLKALRWWRERCLEWCYNRYEDGKFGDQLYLDDWTERFEGVHVMQHFGALAAWNVQQYDFAYQNEQIIGVEKETGKSFEVIFYHYHYLRFFTNGKIELGRRTLSENVLNIFYKPYIQQLDEIKKKIKLIDNSFDPHGSGKQPFNWKTPVLFVYRKMKGVYNIFDNTKFLGD
jgi:hypothetical protein